MKILMRSGVGGFFSTNKCATGYDVGCIFQAVKSSGDGTNHSGTCRGDASEKRISVKSFFTWASQLLEARSSNSQFPLYHEGSGIMPRTLRRDLSTWL